MSLKTKIFSLVTLVVVLSFFIVIWIVFAKTLHLAEKDAFDLAQETAESYKNEIKAELQGSRVTAETLATVFETLKRHDLTDREMMNDILRSALAKKDYITAFCVAYDPDALDGMDDRYAGQAPAYDETGRYSPYWNKLGDTIAVEPLHDIDIADWYINPKATHKEYITDPYPYQVQGKPVMLASLIFPIIHQGNFIGIVASDIVLDTIQEMVTRVNPRGRGGYTAIVSNSGFIVAHPDKRHLGKDLLESTLHQFLVDNPGWAGQAAAALRRISTGPLSEEGDGTEERAQALALLRAVEAYAADPERAPDLDLFTPRLARETLRAAPDISRILEEVRNAVEQGETYMVRDAKRYTVYTPIRFSEDTRPWSVAVSIPMDVVLANADNIRNYVIAVALISLLALSVILYFITRSFTWPILQLARAAKTIGDGDTRTRIPEVGGGNEIGILAGALRFMTERNGELIGKMQEYANQLEDKNEYLNRLNELKDEFLANTSHELRTPIHGIIGIAESMVDGAVGPLTGEQKYNLAIVANSGKRLSNMINDILDFTKLRNKEIALNLKPVDLDTIVDTVLVLSKPLVKGKSVNFANEIPESFPMVEADENRIQQILYNLIGNAAKFTERGQVRVAARVVDGYAVITVSDTGIGIPEDKLELIFESFEQVDGSTEREYGGTGLGLSISRKLVELHGGTLSVESTVGQGSSFSFTVPLSREERKPAVSTRSAAPVIDMDDYLQAQEAEESGQTVDGEETVHRILAVDDEPVNLQVLKNLLRMRRCSITTAYSGAEALKLLEGGERFDLILLDVMMPKMSGYEVCRNLRLRHSLFELPILMLTAKNQLQDIVLGFQAGANDYLSKPFDKEELRARVQTLLSLKTAVTTAIENEMLFENEKQKRILERTLLEVTNAITSTLDLKEVLSKVLEAMSHFIHFDKSLVLLQEEEEVFRIEVARGGTDPAIREGEEVPVAGDEFLGQILRTGRPVVDGDVAGILREWRGEGRILAGVPILYRNNLLGMIVLSCREGEISRELLFTLAGQAGVAIQNARMFAKINVMATTDGLTKLFNRRYFFELVDKEFAKFRRYGRFLSVCMIDIDHFKKINDTYGHPVGDDVLRHLAGKLSELLREYDIVGRYGGEEFAVAFPETPLDVAVKIAERIRRSIESEVVEAGESGPIRITLSIGVAAFSKEAKSVSSIFELADKALYRAKTEGRNRVMVAEEEE